MFNPIARTEKLTIRQLPDETLVYDHQTGKGHCLNPIAALVWKQCDGTATVAELARCIGQPAAVVELALEQLSRRDLLVQPAPQLNPASRLARRTVLRNLAIAAALPLILTVTATRAHASGKHPSLPRGLCNCVCTYDLSGNPIGVAPGNCNATGGTCQCDACPAIGPAGGAKTVIGACV